MSHQAVALDHHAAAQHCLLVDVQVDGVGGNDVQRVLHVVGLRDVHRRHGPVEVVALHFLLLLCTLVAHPVFQDVLQLEGVFAEDLSGFCRRGLLYELYGILHVGVDDGVVVGAVLILYLLPVDGQRGRVVGRAYHLVDVPVGLQVAQVAHTGVGAHAFGVLVVPEGEGVVVAVGEDDGVAILLQGHEIVLSEVAAGVAVGAVVVIPGL